MISDAGCVEEDVPAVTMTRGSARDLCTLGWLSWSQIRCGKLIDFN